MLTDRALLELAAKAAGIRVRWNDQDKCFAYLDAYPAGLPPMLAAHRGIWDPLTDDGDALRLAIKLGINISIWGGATYVNKPGRGPVDCKEVHGIDGRDAYAATRRAIVRAAAEIGNAMPDAQRVNVAPWPDYAGRPIREGDTIVHPHSGERGKVVFLPNEAHEGDQWRVDYGTGFLSSLGLQIGDKGQAVVDDPRCSCPSGDGSLAWPCPSHPPAAEPDEDQLRTEFERQHKGRNLLRHRLRGTYSSAPIAALWNQHKRTAEWCARLATRPTA